MLTPDQRATRNVRGFVAFRVLFNARYYYPVFAVMFLDLGLTAAEFGWLNALWAVAIVVCEVPSGAMADRLGRRRLVVGAAVLMVLEMLLLAFVPAGRGWLLFGAMALNRVISGAAEASASGADEALVYDSLAEAGRAGEWPQVLERVTRWQSAAFFVVMMTGAAVYDADFVNRVLGFLGVNATCSHELAHRLPAYGSLLHAVGALAAALSLRECRVLHPGTDTARSAWHTMADAARDIWHSAQLRFVVGIGVVTESMLMLFMCVVSVYFRLVHVPEAQFGLVGSAMALLGVPATMWARRLVSSGDARRNYAIVCAVMLAGLAGLPFQLAWWGLTFVLIIRLAGGAGSFLSSHYVNAAVESQRRATVLSFRGLFKNLSFGALMAGFSLLVARGGGDAAVGGALVWFPVAFAAMAAVVFLLTGRDSPARPGSS